ncbi:MAG: acetyl-CoA C-acetyltransferase [Chlamydiales bacterium]|jgi:acetyl-CoA C-acetyltransferase
MKPLRKKIYAAAGYNSIFFGTGRKEFNPKKPMPTFEMYLKEAAEGTCAQLQSRDFDEGVISNTMAPRFLKQANIPGFLPFAVPTLKGKPCTATEGACGSGGRGLAAAARSILSDEANAVYVTGFEIQNNLKAVYGADILSSAGYYCKERKDGYAHFFPGVFAERAGAYYEKYGAEDARRGMAKWYELSILNARKNSKAQEYHNSTEDLFALGMTPPSAERFVPHLNVFDCSKVSDGASSIALFSEEGLAKFGVKKEDCVEIVGIGASQGDITQKPGDLTYMENNAAAASKALEQAGIKKEDLALLELHDCFTITALLVLESLGFAERGKGAHFLLDGGTAIDSTIPTNLSGGLCGFGHPVGVSGVRQLVDLLHQFTGKAENPALIEKPYGMLVSMGGNDITVTSVVVKKAS